MILESDDEDDGEEDGCCGDKTAENGPGMVLYLYDSFFCRRNTINNAIPKKSAPSPTDTYMVQEEDEKNINE